MNKLKMGSDDGLVLKQKTANFSHMIKQSLNILLSIIFYKFIKRGKDCFMLLEQDKGAGKSTLAIRIAKAWIKFIKPLTDYPLNFNYRRHVIYDDDIDSILERIRHLPKFSPLIFDEGGRIILAEDWNRKSNKQIKKLFSEIRTKHLLVIICCPFAIDDVDKKYLKNFIQYWIHLWGFGRATIFKKNLHPLRKGFQLKYLDNLLPEFIDDIEKEVDFGNIVNNVKNHPCYYGVLYWQKLSDKEYAEYQILRDDAVYSVGGDEVWENSSDKVRKRQFKLIKMLENKGVKVNEIADNLDMTPSSVSMFKNRFSKSFPEEAKQIVKELEDAEEIL